MLIRKLEKNDYHNNFLQLLSQLTIIDFNNITFEQFSKHFDKINSDIYVIILDNKVIGCGTLLIEQKFIHNLSSVGHIEDIVIDNNYRNKGYGKIIIEYLVLKAKNEGCYKVILDCDEKNVEFYKKCNFIEKGKEMALYF
ncbi:acetyltransferase GNAT family protein [Hokovirus HKV1]|uniref:glucosamine-phosphate N-acetyltransferase n=1 Tax=Hokovirus HKV1 TaxID=1977638 RepID=A0A1V0SFT4_9VIRU|nr:acetyltransferase GNAT family protein [Hokovirus HKV1]